MPSAIPGPPFWTATKCRHEFLAHKKFGVAQQYVTDGYAAARPDVIQQAEQSVVNEGLVRPNRSGTLTRGGVKVADRLAKLGHVIDRTP